MDDKDTAAPDLSNFPLPQQHPSAAGDPEGFDAPAAPQPPHQAVAGTPHSDPIPPIADDVDLIERAWVDKAKMIVDQTKDDPFKQKQQLSHFKADYMRQRYNKDVKTGEQG